MATPHKPSARAKSSPAKAVRPAKARTSPATTAPNTGVSVEQRHRLIAEAAYLRAEQRGFAYDGDCFDDWLVAEREIDALLAENAAPTTHQ